MPNMSFYEDGGGGTILVVSFSYKKGLISDERSGV